MAATKSAILMLMIGSLSCAILAVFLSLLVGISVIIAVPGLVIGAFFAIKYVMYDKSKVRDKEEEEQKRRRRRRHNR